MSSVSTIQPFENVPKIFIDPLFENQKYCLVSFTPSKGATPDKDGIFGMSKVRGVFHTVQEANDRAEWLIRNHDQSSVILTTFVGRPYPVCVDTKKYIEETNNVDLQTKISTTLKEEAREKREADKRAMAEMKEREETLLKDVEKPAVEEGSSSSQDPEDLFENYTMMRVKRAHLIFTYNEQVEKMEKMKQVLVDCDTAIRKTDAEDNDFKDRYMQRYNDARNEVGCKFDSETTATFMKYLDDDRELSTVLKTI